MSSILDRKFKTKYNRAEELTDLKRNMVYNKKCKIFLKVIEKTIAFFFILYIMILNKITNEIKEEKIKDGRKRNKRYINRQTG